ncbi:hypothetical protein HDV01_002092 [Terramyces sp. JEL0728]|nr:hypothetical protein HDV01_002092 [Terramyces sp. JEL0728]
MDLTVLANEYYIKYPFNSNLTGTLTKHGIVLLDPKDNCPKMFFIFNDLNIKVKGEYILICTLVNVEEYNLTYNSLRNVISVKSKPFYVELRSNYTKTSIKTSLSLYLERQLEAKPKRH